jgi:Mg-chelatase subunit ChlI
LKTSESSFHSLKDAGKVLESKLPLHKAKVGGIVGLELIEELRRAILEKLRKGKDPLEGFFASEDVKEGILSVLVAGRHLLLKGPPGIGKTTAAKIIAGLLPPTKIVRGCRFGCAPQNPVCPDCKGKKNIASLKIPGNKRFVRVQGSPELMPEDLVGEIDLVMAMKHGIHDPRAFTPGKVHKAHRKILFIDELNRIPERTQSTLLQVLEEGMMTIAGFDLEVNVDTLVIATINPEESAGAERVSDTLRDRFEVIRIGYPTRKQEIEILKRYGRRIGDVEITEDVMEKSVNIARSARSQEDVDYPVTVRTTLSIFEQAQAIAKLHNSSVVRDKDVEKAARIALNGRLSLSAGSRYYDDQTLLIEKIIETTRES